MILSASQLRTYARCPRLWWLEKVQRIPDAGPPEYGTVFGSVLHACVERWLLADDSGRGPDGHPVEVYPLGWQWDEDGHRIEPEDEDVIRSLIDQAIEKGILQRLPGRQVEHHFTGMMIQGAGRWGPHVLIQGYIDLLHTYSVIDHKTTKGMRYAGSERPDSPRYLGTDDQLLLYAKVLLDRFEEPPEKITLQHNVFDRVEVQVHRRRVTVTPEEIETRWAELEARAKEMLDLQRAGLFAHEWQRVPGACEGAGKGPDACSMYRGCRFVPLCYGEEKLHEFQRRMLRLAIPDLKVPAPSEEEVQMSLRDRINAAKRKKSATPPPADPGINSPEKPDAAEADAAEAMEQLQDEDCVPDNENPPAAVGVDEKAPVAEELKQAPDSLSKSDLTKLKKAELVELAQRLQRLLRGALREEAEALEREEAELLKILFNAVPLGARVVTPAEVLHHLIESEGTTLDVYYAKDGFKRRDALKTKVEDAKAYVMERGGTLTVAGPMTYDEQELVAALRALADVEIVGTVR